MYICICCFCQICVISVGHTHWHQLQTRQREIGGLLIKLGDGLILPGDDDWSEPFTGDDDYQNVKSRV